MTADSHLAAGLADERLRKRRLSGWELLLRSPEFLIGAATFTFWVTSAAVGPWVVPHDPYDVNQLTALAPPSAEYWFGTDVLGRDVFSRVIVGAREILTISLLAAVLALVLGTTIGLGMGYFGGIVDETLSRMAEAMISLPAVIFALMALTALGPSMITLIAVVGFRSAWVMARTVRVAVLVERNEDYVSAAVSRGERTGFILFGEILPNAVPVIVVEFTTRIAYSAFAVANLSFLGFGVQAPSPDWGLQIADSYPLLPAGYWWTALFPALALASLVIGIYLIAEATHEVLER
jgi:peptide/nickel transport system permease protein